MYNFPGNYYHAMDRASYFVPAEGAGGAIEQPIDLKDVELTDGTKPWNLNLGPDEIGQSINPFQHQLQALNAKIKEGASRMEFGFFGAGKGNKERATPESFDKEERREMRELAEINQVRTTTHATVGVEGLAGFNPQRGFEEQTRDQGIREVKKAIDFAAEASTGGAIVLHTGEWARPIYDSHKKDMVKGEEYNFTGYEGEDKRAPIMVVDDRTGEMIAMRKDTKMYEPKFKTVKDYEQETGKRLTGTTDKNGNKYEANDWIGVNEDLIKRDWEFSTDKTDKMFLRVPIWDKDNRNFKTEDRDWNYFEQRAKEWNERNPDKQLSPEEIFAKTQYMNQVLQTKGSALYYAQRYESEYERLNEARKALEFYKQLNESLPEDEKRSIMMKKSFDYGYGVIPPKDVPIKDWLEQFVKESENSIRHVHEASAAADVQTRKAEDSMKHVTTVHDYGITQTAKSMADLGVYLWQKYETHKDELKEPIYLAPENWHPNNYGSHPDELLEIVRESRKEMTKRLAPSMGKERAEEIARTHIKTTIDTGHLNLWKSHLQRKENESDEQFDKRFSKWAITKMEKLHKEGAIGHIHLTDNFGYDDEHLTLGKGNAPVKEMVEFFNEKGYKDFIVEGGSFNPNTILHEAWSRIGSPVYSLSGAGHGPRFSQVQHQHFGYQAPPFRIVGAYSPISEEKIWSETPLE